MSQKPAVRICNRYMGGQRAVPAEQLVLRPSVYAVICNDGHVLLVTNNASGRYYLPGGALDPGESLTEGLAREVWEEAGIEISIGRFLTAAEDFLYYDPTETAYHALLFYYQATPLRFTLSAQHNPD